MCLINARSVANKAHILNDLFTRENLDILFVTETWQQNMEFIHLNELCPVDCSFIGTPRLSGRGGGLAVVWNNRFSCQLVNTEPFTTFELQLTKVGRLKPFYCVLIYRPPGPAGQFLSEFTDFLASIIKLEKVLLVGDFNLHIDDASNVIASEFLNITESFNFRQHVSGATHIGGHTLDLVFSLGLDINNICCEDLLISDHKCIFFTLSATAEPLYPVTTLRSRIITQTTAEQFSAQFCLEFNADFNNVEFLVQSFNKQCSALLDKVAPLKVMSRATNNSSPWVTDAVRRLRQMCRRSERLWKATGLEVHRLYLKELRQSFNVSVREARSAYFANLISSSKRNPKVLFDTINNLVAPPSSTLPCSSSDDCNKFLTFIVDKVTAIRSSMPSGTCPPTCSPPSSSTVLDSFHSISLQDLLDVIRNMKVSSSSVDVIPSSLFLNVLPTIGPNLLTIVNSSLSTGCVPSYFKHASIHPILKKPNLDPVLLNSYRPISKLPLLSKILEKVVASQITAALERHNIYDKFQSGFRKQHSTETALLRVSSDILMSSDAGDTSVLVLLDLSSAFDTVDHRILIKRLRDYVGISGIALDWLSSYLTDRSFSISIGDFVSNSSPLSCGVPQGSVLGPLLFSLYLLPLGKIISHYDVAYHLYADDIQLQFAFKPSEPYKLSRLLDCLNAIRVWTTENSLQLNADKTEVLVVAPDKCVSVILKNIGHLSTAAHSNLRNLGVIFNNSMSFDTHVKHLSKSCFFHLRNICKLRSVVSTAELEMIIHAFIFSRLDYCNSLFTSLSTSALNRLQAIQNAAARLLTRSSRRCHITPLLKSLHWLPVTLRIRFKILTITYNSLHGQAPAYLAELIHPHQSTRSLRSNSLTLLSVPRTQLKTRGDRAFAAIAPRYWNALPASIRSAESFVSFKGQLKTHLFRLAFG